MKGVTHTIVDILREASNTQRRQKIHTTPRPDDGPRAKQTNVARPGDPPPDDNTDNYKKTENLTKELEQGKVDEQKKEKPVADQVLDVQDVGKSKKKTKVIINPEQENWNLMKSEELAHKLYRKYRVEQQAVLKGITTALGMAAAKTGISAAVDSARKTYPKAAAALDDIGTDFKSAMQVMPSTANFVSQKDMLSANVATDYVAKNKSANGSSNTNGSTVNEFVFAVAGALKKAHDKKVKLDYEDLQKEKEKEKKKNLDELSTKTLKSYETKATSFANKDDVERDARADNARRTTKTWRQAFARKHSRESGVKLAHKKLSEEIQLDEVSRKLAISYISRAEQDQRKQTRRFNAEQPKSSPWAQNKDEVNKKNKSDKDDISRKYKNRKAGLFNAWKRLPKLDELSAKTIGHYLNKARDSMDYNRVRGVSSEKREGSMNTAHSKMWKKEIAKWKLKKEEYEGWDKENKQPKFTKFKRKSGKWSKSTAPSNMKVANSFGKTKKNCVVGEEVLTESDPIAIQYQTAGGTWVTAKRVGKDAPNIIIGMESVQKAYGHNRVRAIDQQGRLIDMLAGRPPEYQTANEAYKKSPIPKDPRTKRNQRAWDMSQKARLGQPKPFDMVGYLSSGYGKKGEAERKKHNKLGEEEEKPQSPGIQTIEKPKKNADKN